MTLHIKELLSIGAVDNGDNPEAEIVFWKRRKAKQTPDGGDSKGEPMIEGFDLSALPDDTRDALAAHFEVLKAERDAALEAVPPPVEEAEVEKALPDDIAELIAKAHAKTAEAEAALAVEVEKRATVELVTKYEHDGLTPLLGAAEEVAPQLRALQAAAPEAFAAVYGNLVAAAQRVDLAKALGELGENTGEAPDPYTQRDQWVGKMLTADPNADVVKLRSDFWKLHPDAFAETRNK